VPHPHLEEDVVGDPTQVAGSEGGGNDASGARSVPADEFKAAFRLHASGVAVVTADAGDGPVALTASSVSSVSADPPVLTFSVSGRTSSAETLIAAPRIVVHLLGADQLELAVRCATPGVDRFADTSGWERLATGEPSFLGARARLVGEVIDRRVYGDSTVLALRVLRTDVAPDADRRLPLAYHDRTWHQLGEASQLPRNDERERSGE